VSIDPVIPDETFTYYLDTGNTSAVSLTNTELRAYLPAGVTVNAVSDGGAEVVDGEVVWDIGSLAVGQLVHREITVAADMSIEGNVLKLVAELHHDDGVAVDNRSEFSLTVVESNSVADLLGLDITSAPASVAAGDTLSYTITLTNNYGLQLQNVRVLLRVPDRVSFHSGNDAAPDCDYPFATYSNWDEAVWTLDTLAAGATQVITVDATVSAGIGDGNLIVAPFRVTADDMEDVINWQSVTGIDN
jgi:uncharacterized repeat protein (TIGR01451 family)